MTTRPNHHLATPGLTHPRTPPHPHEHPVARRRALRGFHVVVAVLVLVALALLLRYGAQYEQGWDRRTDLTVCRLAEKC